MIFKQETQILKCTFEKEHFSKVKAAFKDRWPVVYIIEDDEKGQAYIGESTNICTRICDHWNNTERRALKNIYIIGGTMGVGKSTVSQILKEKLNNSIFLDGDWCWDAHPFQVTEETKQMVLQNICFLLNQFIRCSAYENIICCWVMHEQGIIDEIISQHQKKVNSFPQPY